MVAPEDHTYVLAPLAVKVAKLKAQTVTALGAATTVGTGIVETEVVVVLTQPFASVPVTVNTVLFAVLNKTLEPVAAPAFQV